MKDSRVLIGIIVSVIATGLLGYVVDLGAVLTALQQADLIAVGAATVAIVVAMWTKAMRWQAFFPRPRAVRVRGLHEAIYIGYMANALLPLRAGEIVRAVLAAETERTSRSTALATVLIEKVVDVGTMALILYVLGLVFTQLPDSARYVALLSGAGLAIAIGAVAFALLARPLTLRLTRALELRVGLLAKLKLTELLGAFLDGLAFAQKPLILARVLVWTVIHWGLSALAIVFSLLAVGIHGRSISELVQITLLVMVATNLSMAIPSAPGYVGVFHGVFVATLALFGVREDLATAAAVVSHAVVFGVFILGGAYYLLFGEAMKNGERRLTALVVRARTPATGTT